MEYIILFLVLALVAEIIGTIGGFGSSLFFVPIAGFFFEFHVVLGITALFHVSSNITKIYFFRKGVDKQLILYVGIPAVLFVIAGAIVSKYINTEILEIILSIFLIILSLIFLLFKKLIISPTKSNSIIGGASSGFFAGLVGTGGAIRGITMAAFNLKTDVFIATSAIIDLGIDLSRSVVYTMNGYVNKDILYSIPLLLIVSIIGTYIGKKILDRVSEQQFKSMVLVLILLTGLATLLKLILPDFSL